MANSIGGTSADKFDLDPLWQNLDWYVLLLDALSACIHVLPLPVSLVLLL